MRLRLLWLACLISFGCHTFTRSARELVTEPARSADPVETAPEQPKRSHLSLAALYLERGDDERACEHLGRFLREHPEHANARYYHAELLFKRGKKHEALAEFEEAVAYAQDERERDLKHLVHCHGRLLAIGEALEDDYLVHLHRGIGMCLLAQRHATVDDPDGELSTEGLLCKAAAELAIARTLRPAESRPCWYLHVAWRQLGQPQQAARWLARASEGAAFCYLTPSEQRDLQLACAPK